MAIHITQYEPDTCECIIQYQWDDTLPETSRVHTLSNYVRVCAAHQLLVNDTQRWDTVFSENPKKSRSLETILANGPAALYDVVNGIRQLKQTLSFIISWSGIAPNRILTVRITGVNLTQTQRNTIQNALNSRFGVGQVILG